MREERGGARQPPTVQKAVRGSCWGVISELKWKLEPFPFS